MLGVLVGVLLVMGSAAMASKGDLVSINQAEINAAKAPMQITLGKADMIELDGDVSDVLVADPSIVDVQAIQSNRLYIVGLAIGDTNIITLDANGDVIKRLDVHVSYDLQAIQGLVNDLFPEEQVTIGSIHGQILLTGKVSNPEVATKVSNIVGHYVSELQDMDNRPIDEMISNLMEVRGEQQVMLQVRIIEATRSVLKEFGLESNANDNDEALATRVFGSQVSRSQFSNTSDTNDPTEAAFATAAGIALSQDPAGIGRFLFDSGISGIGTIGLFLSALEEENLVNTLAEPNLTAVSGEQAGFLAGGEFPVPVGRDQVGNLVIEFREFGVSLNFRPVVMSDKRISLQMNTEVSALDFTAPISTSDLIIPGLTVRRAETTVEVPSGGSLMIAGLLQSEAVKGMAGLPGIRKTPILGDLVKSDSFARDETELVVIVTPILVEPYADESRAEEVPAERQSPLAMAFSANIRRAFELEDEEIFADNVPYGYLVD
jgi:pilus assembly protein CpaC